ncbi:MAG: hypothetical protein HY381_02490, partial [Candidatus Chisholmbacteria bacterium]|nr:hypothetical protein [Candidatus Chisholmbacteria bacterium]
MRKSTAHNQHFLFLKNQLAAYQKQSKQQFVDKHPRAAEWLKRRQLNLGTVRQQSQRLLTGATLSSLLLLASPQHQAALPAPTKQQRLARAVLTSAGEWRSKLVAGLKPLLPARIGHPDREKESEVSRVIQNVLGIKAVATLEGQRLNHSLGFIGYEQHLQRFPGDSLRLH